MRCLALIPARGGSKRLPRKNVADFRGEPIIVHTIRAALATGAFARVVVSTDDSEAADIARRAGAEVLERPAELATDTAGVREVCLQVLDAEAARGREYDVLCCLYATAPLRGPEDIRAVLEPVLSGRTGFSLAVTRYGFPPHQALAAGPDGALAPVWPEMILRRSQEVPDMVVDNGSTYAVSVPAFRRERTFYGPGLAGYLMPRLRSVDIDTAEDLELARLLAEGGAE